MNRNAEKNYSIDVGLKCIKYLVPKNVYIYRTVISVNYIVEKWVKTIVSQYKNYILNEKKRIH